jgi:non-ribosomal peptide synthetase component F
MRGYWNNPDETAEAFFATDSFVREISAIRTLRDILTSSTTRPKAPAQPRPLTHNF